MAEHLNPNALSYWFPRLEVAGLPVPKTIMVDMPKDVWWSIYCGMHGEESEPADMTAFLGAVRAAGDELGWPCFLRSDHTSHKHNWRGSCFLDRGADIAQHVYDIAEFSEMVGFMVGMSWDRWAIREMLPVRHLGYCRGYGDMPVVREFRFFVTDGNVDCWHPYWPESALRSGFCEYLSDADYADVAAVSDLSPLTELASSAGAAVGGSWSVDILDTERGWVVTDMAIAKQSYHWEGCPNG
jgi:hypothetical protein